MFKIDKDLEIKNNQPKFSLLNIFKCQTFSRTFYDKRISFIRVLFSTFKKKIIKMTN